MFHAVHKKKSDAEINPLTPRRPWWLKRGDDRGDEARVTPRGFFARFATRG